MLRRFRTLSVLIALALAAVASDATLTYQVKRADTLTSIGQYFGVSVSELAAANGISADDYIYAGQMLTIPGSQQASYTIKPGDTLTSIAHRFGVDSATLVSINGLSSPDRILAGRTLNLWGTAKSAAPSKALGSAPTSSTAAPKAASGDRWALHPVFDYWAKQYGVPADLVKAIAYQESGWQSHVVSGVGAKGVMQIMPATEEWISRSLLGSPTVLNAFVPEQGIQMGVRYVAYLLDYFDGNTEMAIAAYYQGQGSVMKKGLYTDTKQYVANVQLIRNRFR
ncbi:MAG: LysM peptidoglycan-binding domain-containing protein [Actinobacteria bacterium]|nr:LysM peptidoglycan-binding domain-containing protein [Actinomycetota bacterium]MCB9388735.1 LysM peptidoglycan-binding domain-containing protein [Acidimicrobiia bacterium]